MSKHIDNSRFMVSPLVSESIGFYQEILRGLGSNHQLGKRLIQLAEQAHAFRQFDRVKELAQVLINVPIKTYQAIGHYYLAVAFNNCGKGELDKAKKLFELAADTAPLKYQAKAILSLAAVSAHQKDPDAELYYFAETLKVSSSNIGTRLTALRGIAVHKAREGYHPKALKDLERDLPMINYASPEVCFSHLNALAVELGEVGRIHEARNISRIEVAFRFCVSRMAGYGE